MNQINEYPVFSLVNNYLNKERVIFQDLVELQELTIPLSWRLGSYHCHLQSLSIIYLIQQNQWLVGPNQLGPGQLGPDPDNQMDTDHDNQMDTDPDNQIDDNSKNLKTKVSALESLLNKLSKVMTMMMKHIRILLDAFEFKIHLDAIHQINITCINYLQDTILPGFDELERTTPITSTTLSALVTEYDDKCRQVFDWINVMLEYIMQIDDIVDSKQLDLAPYELQDQLATFDF